MKSCQTVISKNIILIGPPMAGKTTLTARLAGDDKFVSREATIGK